MAMIQWWRRFGWVGLCLVLSACTSTPPIEREQPPIEERVIVDGRALPYPDEAPLQTESLGAGSRMSGVVRNLLDQAVEYKNAGDYEAASATLERALRIESRNPWVWHELADLSVTRTQYQQAIQFAQRSNTLLGQSDRALQRRNWKLISVAYAAVGNERQAELYRAKL